MTLIILTYILKKKISDFLDYYLLPTEFVPKTDIQI